MNILVTSGRAPASLELIRLLSLGGHTVHVADSFDIHISKRSKGVFKNHLVPRPRQETVAYGDALEDIILEEKIDLVIPTFEESFWVSRFKKRLETYCPVFVDELSKLRKLHNKSDFIKYCQELGIQAPSSTEVHSKIELNEALSDLEQVVLKPSFSRFGEEVLVKPSAKEISSIDFTNQRSWVIQEFLDGPQFCSYALCRDGHVLASAIYPSEIKSNKVSLNFRHIEHQAIHEWVKNFAKKSNFTGQLSFDFIDSEKGLMAIECNPRMTSGLHLFEDRDDFHTIFENDFNSILTPSLKVRNMMGILVILYGMGDFKNITSNIKTFIQSRDIIFRRNDIMPFFDQFKTFIWLAIQSRRHGISLSKFTTVDIEWNGEV
ncbi:MAG: hypothetical protein COW01_08925 [Bdellovibrionales bacterium CG12_big_fil_rev_8_21_14_0_65_38_15]|nr:MAG: hypothetical protein COW79_15900 [Bdellovibrionales bacterium CG22_combo_CG10-13_8_21_14_all_38_13]PIQ54994.1 MAG: hypothetical protein COW01_08925 [Bdellovibrionales bacterium CG12_big_fil_rev_8_21_14_0_65_38_15]PIR30945.1 MAG: hypothetical protein COV38_02780 [Bdellovibrionales bacterium CG11_big_fil_rev_8_21_14_0_20_38_13]